MKKILLIISMFFVIACDDDSSKNNNLNNAQGVPVRSDCSIVVQVDAASDSSAVVVGDFTSWDISSGIPMLRDSYRWTARFSSNVNDGSSATVLAPGYHQYKIVRNGADWGLDPQNPYTAFDDTQQNENSLLILPDCSAPSVTEEQSEVDYEGGTFRVAFQLYRGADGASIEGVEAQLFQGDTEHPISVSYNADTGAGEVTATAAEMGKYKVHLHVNDSEGRSVEKIFPVWFEPEPLSWEDMTLYSIFIDRFYNGDAANDAPIDTLEQQVNWQGGDWKGITQKLRDGYFEDLGITALWLSTPMDNPDHALPGDCGQSFSGYHAYWPQSARGVENHFGTAEDLKELVQEAHKRGIRVLVDWAANHIFIDHPLHLEHEGNPFWFNYPGSTLPDEYWRNKCGELGWNEYALTCWFTEYLPDYNHRNQELVDQLIEDALWWVETFDLDGFRVDATKHIRSNYLRLLRRALDMRAASKATPFYMVGENFLYDYGIINEKISEHELQGQFDFPLYGAIRDALIPGQVNLSALNSFVYNSFIDNQGITDLDWSKEGASSHGTLMGNFLGNHDVERFSSVAAGQANGDGCQAFNSPLVPQPDDATIYRRMALGFAFLLTVRGLPVIYYGDEVGLAGVKDPDNRRPMVFEEGALLAEQISLRDTLSALVHARNSYSSLRRGRYDAFYGDPSCLVYLKSLGTERVIVVLSGHDGCNATVSMKEGYGFEDGQSLSDLLGSGALTINNAQVSLGLPPWSIRLYHLDLAK